MRPLGRSNYEEGFDLSGCSLVEASAGTGKTYTIQSLYLRLIVEKGLTVQQVLVVTFSRAATKELRDRLRAILHACRRLQDGLPATDEGEQRDRDERLTPLLMLPVQGERTHADSDTRERAWRVQRALLDFDEAAIYNIHGFCTRALKRYAFECGHGFDTELAGDSDVILDQLCEDWWRKNTYRAEEDLLALMAHIKMTPDRLKTFARKYVSKPDACWRPDPGNVENVRKELSQLLVSAHRQARELQAAAELDPDQYNRSAEANRFAIKLAAFTEALAQDVSDWSGACLGLDLLPYFENAESSAKLTRASAWPLPPGLQSFVDACARLRSLVAGKRSLDWDGPCLRHASIPNQDLDAALDAIAATWSRAQEDWSMILASPSEYPLKTTKPARTVVEAMERFGDWLEQRGDAVSATDFCKAASKQMAAFAETVPQARALALSDLPATALVDALRGMRTAARRLLVQALREISRDYHRLKSRRSLLSYDDLLIDLRKALSESDMKAWLLQVLRHEFRAALIDEFQDTDPVQYKIFRTIFIDGDLPLFLVGDPKQAIYSFRSGDIFTYYSAAAAVKDGAGDRAYLLDTNYRSEKRLVDGVNQVFRDRRDETGALGRSFLSEQVAYETDIAAAGKRKGKQLLVDGQADEQPFKLWYYQGAEGKSPGLGSPEALRIYADTADEIARLLNDAATTVAGRPVRPSDIVILVMTHHEALLISRELAERHVYSVRQSTGRVFDSQEALDMATVLSAIATPRSATAVRSALATSLFACSNEDIRRLNDGDSIADPLYGNDVPGDQTPLVSMDDWLIFFAELRHQWTHRSLVEAFNGMMHRTRMRAHLLGMENGERRLTNILQLAELLHQAIVESSLSMESALTWFVRQLDSESGDQSDAYEIRLESDEDAVKIMTVFKSKGLQFPIVFVPTLWRRAPHIAGDLLEHHSGAHAGPGDPPPLVVALSREDADGESAEFLEKLSEDVRLFYVAATRAVHRAYVVWGDFATERRDRALAWTLGVDGDPEAWLAATLDGNESLAVDVSRRRFDAAPPETVFAPGPTADDGATLQTLAERTGTVPHIDRTRGHTSFSGIAPSHRDAAEAAPDRYDFDEADAPFEPRPADEAADGITIFNFAAGARTGECWHRIFEELDFQADGATLQAVVAEQLDRFGLSTGDDALVAWKRAVVTDMVRGVLNTPLPDCGFRLRDVGTQRKLAEMEFNFSLRQWDRRGRRGTATERRTPLVTDILQKHWGSCPDRADFVTALEHWDERIPQGYMTGFMDLVFAHDINGVETFFILDWKSNRRDGRPSSFSTEGLREEMAAHAYFLQYLIYTVALHQYLAGRLPSYSYDTHFGGIFYVFVRGYEVAPAHGIYYDRPPLALIEDLSAALGDFS